MESNVPRILAHVESLFRGGLVYSTIEKVNYSEEISWATEVVLTGGHTDIRPLFNISTTVQVTTEGNLARGTFYVIGYTTVDGSTFCNRMTEYTIRVVSTWSYLELLAQSYRKLFETN
ncbi:hypothetical protein M0804_012412 [Polistes exclamans]|nr:hypothetical protein M0804_012412 [Polistes exclamans]